MKDAKKVLSSIIHYISTTYEIKDAGSDRIKLGSKSFNSRQFLDKIKKEVDAIASHCGKSEFYLIIDDIRKQKGCTEDVAIEVIADKVFSHLKGIVSQESKEKLTKVDSSKMVQNAFDWSNHIPINDIKTKESVMFNMKTQEIDYQATYEGWWKYVQTRPNEEKRILLASSQSAVVRYDPYDFSEISYKAVSGQEDILHVNAHKTPRWRKEGIGKGKPVPEDFIKLIKHIFPNPLCQEYVLNWMYYMLTGRNQCYLLMHGKQGVGKGTIVDIMARLVGLENYTIISPSFWEGRFNGELLHKRLAFFDESIIEEDHLSKVKALTNEYISIEAKGLEPIYTQNFCSYIITNNLDRVNHVTYDDRRYSVPVLNDNDQKIEYVLGIEWMDELVEKIKSDDEFIGAIGHFILSKGKSPKFDDKQPYKSSAFYDLVEKSLKLWQKNLLEIIESREYEEIDLASISDDIRGTGHAKVSLFLDTHRDREGESYGYVTRRHRGERYIKVSPKYCPDKEEEEEEENTKSNINLDDLEF